MNASDTAQELNRRQERLVQSVMTDGFKSITALASDLGVSDMTIRRDVKKLAQGGLVRVVHGGASAIPRSEQAGYEDRAISHAEAKRSIGRAAAQLVEAHETIAVDAGTSAHEVTVALVGGFEGSIVTCSVPVFQSLMSERGIHVIGTGGDLYRDSRALVGPAAVETISELRFRTAFIGASAADARGMYVAADLERPTKTALMEGADRVVAVLDSSKFAASAPVRLCTWSQVDVLVTEAEPSPVVARALEEAGVELVVSTAG